MFATLNIVISLVFVLLLFSLLTSTVVDVIAAIFSLKAKNLRYTLENMLGDKMDDFIRHPLFRQISYATTRRARHAAYYLPGYVTKDTFISILRDIMDAGTATGLEDRINRLEDGDLKKMMQFMFRQAGGDAAAFRAQMERWFDEVMARSSDWYRRTMKWWVFGIGFTLAAILNADTIQIYQNIAASPATQIMLTSMARDFAEKTDTVVGPTLNLPLDQAVSRADSMLKKIEAIRSPLGLGWKTDESEKDIYWWLVKLIGLTLTGIATTFGAPFWYDLLKKLLPINKSDKKSEAGEPADGRLAPASPPEILDSEQSTSVEAPEEKPIKSGDTRKNRPVG